MTEDSREVLETVLDDIRDLCADMHAARRKLGEIRQHYVRQLLQGTITRFRYDVEMTDIQRLQRTMNAQWIRLQHQRSRTLEKLRHLA